MHDIKNRNYHIRTGNKGSRKQITTNFDGLKYDDLWKTKLSRTQKNILKLIK